MNAKTKKNERYKVKKCTLVILQMNDEMETRVPGVKGNLQYVSLLQSKSKLPIELLSIPRQQNTRLPTIVYTQIKSLTLELRLL